MRACCVFAAENPDGSYAVSMTLRKLSQPGTHSMWFSMFVNEVPGACMKYRGHSSEGTQGQQYHWSQTVDFMNAFFPIPDGALRLDLWFRARRVI